MLLKYAEYPKQKYAKYTKKNANMQIHCRNICRICKFYAEFSSRICRKCAENVQKICQKYAKNMPKICKQICCRPNQYEASPIMTPICRISKTKIIGSQFETVPCGHRIAAAVARLFLGVAFTWTAEWGQPGYGLACHLTRLARLGAGGTKEQCFLDSGCF